MDLIFHEKQEGFLCAQHCLNALLQSPYFTAVDLADLAHQLDEVERQQLSSEGIQSQDYLNFIENGSQNMDDSGYFSIQVISKALEVWGLELRALQAHEIKTSDNLVGKSAFICHFKNHWLTIRKLGFQWFNLNSLLNGPELLTETYLCLYLSQLRQEGYSIFLVSGVFPHNDADEALKRNPAMPSSARRPLSSSSRQPVAEGSDWMVERAVADSLREAEEEDPSLRRVLEQTGAHQKSEFERQIASAIEQSLSDAAMATSSSPPSREDVRARRQAFLDNLGNR